ncbi:Hypothetical predicted protein [Cloeon dipterum]|uniref:Uncharacterized protein n=1 Tax=Cloeon dipterum TaxID=197152 RepID=A0A8S1C7R0_9INSE|nr:Hypothetical predicted protein [Cloeon dipterum]
MSLRLGPRFKDCFADSNKFYDAEDYLCQAATCDASDKVPKASHPQAATCDASDKVPQASHPQAATCDASDKVPQASHPQAATCDASDKVPQASHPQAATRDASDKVPQASHPQAATRDASDKVPQASRAPGAVVPRARRSRDTCRRSWNKHIIRKRSVHMSKLAEHLAADQQVFLKLKLSQTKHRMRILKLQPAVTHSKRYIKYNIIKGNEHGLFEMVPRHGVWALHFKRKMKKPGVFDLEIQGDHYSPAHPNSALSSKWEQPLALRVRLVVTAS